LIKIKIILFFLIGTLSLSCGRSSYPCPDLSSAAMNASGKNTLPDHRVRNDKKGLVKKKGVKKAKRR